MSHGLPGGILDKVLGVISGNPKVKGIVLYGSRAKGNYRRGSDIDLCLDAEGLSLPELYALESRIDDLLLPWKVDLAVLQMIDNAALLAHIRRVGVVVYVSGTRVCAH